MYAIRSYYAEVLSFVFADSEPETAEGKPCLSILDSTDPGQIAQAAQEYPPDQSIYVVSSKSGGNVPVKIVGSQTQ